MIYQIHYSPLAINDLKRVWADVFRASENIEISNNYLDELLDKISTKKEFPKSGAPLYYQEKFTGYYHIVFKSYIMFYRVEETNVFVDRVLFGKSDYFKVLDIKNTTE